MEFSVSKPVWKKEQEKFAEYRFPCCSTPSRHLERTRTRLRPLGGENTDVQFNNTALTDQGLVYIPRVRPAVLTQKISICRGIGDCFGSAFSPGEII